MSASTPVRDGRRGLRTWAAVVMAFAYVLISAVSFTAGWLGNRDAAWRDARLFARTLVSELVVVAESSVVRNPSTVSDFVAASSTDLRLREAVITDPDGRVVASLRWSDRGQPLAAIPRLASLAGVTGSATVPMMDDEPVRRTVSVRQGFEWPAQAGELRSLRSGQIHVLVDVARTLEALEHKLILQQLLLAVVYAVLVMVLFALFDRQIIRSLAGLQVASEAIAQGRYETRLGPHPLREIDRAGDAFNRMAASLQDVVGRLSGSERRLRELVDTAPDAILAVDRQGIVRSINRAGERLFGYSSAELCGRNLHALLPRGSEVQHDRLLAAFADSPEGGGREMAGGRVVQGCHRDGRMLQLEISISRVPTGVGTDHSFTAVVRDVSKRIEMERALAEYRDGLEVRVAERTQQLQDLNAALQRSVRDLSTKTTILDHAPVGIVVIAVDRPGLVIHYVNQALCELSGRPAGELIEADLGDLLGSGCDTGPEGGLSAAPLPESPRERLEWALLERRATEAELAIVRPDGATRRVQWVVFPCFGVEGELLSMVALLTDVTEIRESEAQRQQLAAELQESTRLQFLGLAIAGISHDLNTPIGIAVTAASHTQQIVDKLVTLSREEPVDGEALRALGDRITRSIELLSRNLDKAARLVTGFKQASADATRTDWTLLHLSGLLDSLLVALSPLLKRAECQVQVHCPADLTLYTEPGAISQTLTNLVINAAIHAFEGRTDRQVRIDVAETPEAVTIDVEDNGNGMSAEAALKAFTPFFTTRRQAGGSGLGLFSSRRAIEQVLGGRLTFDSRPGQGTRFHIHLPRRKPGSTGT